jgi:predicted transcriptional regulator of viral defense system
MKEKPNYQKLYEIAESQGGYFTTKQAERACYSRKDLSALSKRRKFSRVSWGIYRITLFPTTSYDDFFMAVLKSGPHSVISHQSALSIYELSDILPAKIHIIIPKSRSRRREGIKYHTCNLSKNDITSYKGLPITTVERTITDVVRSGLDTHLIEQAINQGINRGMITRVSLLDQASRYSKSTMAAIRSILKGV